MKPALELNSQNFFIKGWYTDNLELCDKLIEHINDPNQKKWTGKSGFKGELVENKNIKDSVDTYIPEELHNEYCNTILNPATTEYCKAFYDVSISPEFKLQEGIQIQKYEPGGGFHSWHCENWTGLRNLVFMTYLNNVMNGGETEWKYQNLRIPPRKGLTIIWPTDWTHTHRGAAAPYETKYVTTGWYEYIVEEDK